MLHTLPPEIALCIVGFADEAERFAAATDTGHSFHSNVVHQLSLVSRYLRDITLPIIFQELTWNLALNPLLPEPEASKRRANAQGCANLLLERPELRKLVRTLRVHGENPKNNFDSEDSVQLYSLVLEVLPLLDDLRVLWFHWTPLTAKLYHAIQAQPSVTSLSFTESYVHEADVVQLANISPFAVQKLKIEPLLQNTPALSVWTRLISSPTITSLSLGHNMVAFHNLNFRKASLTNLKQAGVVIRWVPNEEKKALDFLSKCQEVEDLRVTFLRQDRAVPLPVLDTCLPRLGTYRGGYGCAEEFITGRPVFHIDLNTALRPRVPAAHGWMGHDNGPLLKVLSHGTVPVRFLRFAVTTWKPSLLATVAALFPELQTLRIENQGNFIHETWKKDDGVGAVSRLQRLQHLFIAMSERNFGDTNWQEGVIMKWAAVNQTLSEVWLTRRERWTKCGTEWKRSVRADPSRPVVEPDPEPSTSQ
ncbi:hypothetical protein FRC04_008094 [Tulasnella sp. 424]|nr:hypothetical protein FRC04_008094 [Tulasnella sp. 424]KAG8974751.1 hypothetical protein FRC05_006911 [Tulasnella sp. 425]